MSANYLAGPMSLGNTLQRWYAGGGWRRVVALVALSPAITLAMVLLPVWVLWMALTWDGR